MRKNGSFTNISDAHVVVRLRSPIASPLNSRGNTPCVSRGSSLHGGSIWKVAVPEIADPATDAMWFWKSDVKEDEVDQFSSDDMWKWTTPQSEVAEPEDIMWDWSRHRRTKLLDLDVDSDDMWQWRSDDEDTASDAHWLWEAEERDTETAMTSDEAWSWRTPKSAIPLEVHDIMNDWSRHREEGPLELHVDAHALWEWSA